MPATPAASPQSPGRRPKSALRRSTGLFHLDRATKLPTAPQPASDGTNRRRTLKKSSHSHSLSASFRASDPLVTPQKSQRSVVPATVAHPGFPREFAVSPPFNEFVVKESDKFGLSNCHNPNLEVSKQETPTISATSATSDFTFSATVADSGFCGSPGSPARSPSRGRHLPKHKRHPLQLSTGPAKRRFRAVQGASDSDIFDPIDPADSPANYSDATNDTSVFSPHQNSHSFRLVKPLQTAFVSAGLLSKLNRAAHPTGLGSAKTEADSSGLSIHPPETPCKKTAAPGFPLSPVLPPFSMPRSRRSKSSLNVSVSAGDVVGAGGTSAVGSRDGTDGTDGTDGAEGAERAETSQDADGDSVMSAVESQRSPGPDTMEIDGVQMDEAGAETEDETDTDAFSRFVSDQFALEYPATPTKEETGAHKKHRTGTPANPYSWLEPSPSKTSTPALGHLLLRQMSNRISGYLKNGSGSGNGNGSGGGSPNRIKPAPLSITDTRRSSTSSASSSSVSVPISATATGATGATTAPPTRSPARTPARTPKTPSDRVSRFLAAPTAPGPDPGPEPLDPSLLARFDDVKLVGAGQFSLVYFGLGRNSRNAAPPEPLLQPKYAIKRNRLPWSGPKTRARLQDEVACLRKLCTGRNRPADGEFSSEFGSEFGAEFGTVNSTASSLAEIDPGREYIVDFVAAWENPLERFLYIQTEYCENGTLDTFLAEHGRFSRLDEWRVWKIFVELAFGLEYIHRAGILHLDLKPANVFISFEGSLKIGDFGMATEYPVPEDGFEREGDREYIAPEILSARQYGPPADVFSLGLVMLEIAANIVLPDNGVSWQKLRSGDLSDAGRLSSGDLRRSGIAAGAPSSGVGVETGEGGSGSGSSSSSSSDGMLRSASSNTTVSHGGCAVPEWAPPFMRGDAGPLDDLVRWMLSPNPSERPTAAELVTRPEVLFIEERRRTGATIYEGDFGPPPDEEEAEAGVETEAAGSADTEKS